MLNCRLFKCVRRLCKSTRSCVMFKKQKLDGTNPNMPNRESNNSPSNRSPSRRKSRSPFGRKIAGSHDFGGHLNSTVGIDYLPSPIKSENDSKDYQVVRLPNGLIATLISDTKNLGDLNLDAPTQSSSESSGASSTENDSDVELDDENSVEGKKEKLAACSLTVEVGSFSDPDEIQGLSHFLEHMVFMGSEKYPKENEFDSFIKRYGGSDNAFTECQYTTYYFECPEKQLYKALDIFSQFFIKPLLKWDAINREREAIESEFQEAFPHDCYRKDQLLCSFADQRNPARKFTWGNQTTLRDNVDDKHLFESVNAYREKHYSSDRMKLAIQARLPIPLLKEWVVQCFSQVPKLSNKADIFPQLPKPFVEEKFCRFYYVNTVKDLTEIEIRWVLPSVVKRYKTKPLKYLSFVIGHEGKGSLLSFLKKKLWALNIRAGSAEDGLNMNDIYTIFVIGITLTDEGRAAVEQVLTATFAYVQMLQQTGPNERLFAEVQTLSEIGFRFQEETSAVDNVENLSQCMLLYPSEDYLRGDELLFEYNPQEIEDFLSKMTPSTSNIMLFSKSHDVVLDEEEFWFKTKYKSEPINEKWLSNWRRIEANKEFQLPEKNRFISTNFSLVDHQRVPKYPEKIRQSDLVDIWYKGDDKFKLPLASIDIYIVTPSMMSSAELRVYGDVFTKLLHHNLVEELYHAVAADLEYAIVAKDRGIHVSAYGYNEHLDLLVDRIAQGIKHFNEMAEEGVLEAFKKLFARGYFNETLKASSLAKELRQSAYMVPYFTAPEKYRHVKNVTMSKLKDFVDSFFEKVHFQALVQGNLTAVEGARIVDAFVETVQPKNPLTTVDFQLARVKILPKGVTCFRVASFNLEDQNCVTTVYYQYGPGTIREYVALELFVMIMEEPLFDNLRTQQQLGYDVSTTVRETNGILGISVTVCSQINKFTVEHVQKRIDEFVYDFVKAFPEIPKDDFKDSQDSLISLKSNVDTYLKEETKRNFEEIKSQEFVFDRQEKEINLIGRLTKKSVAAVVDRIVDSSGQDNHRKLVIQVVGHKTIDDDSDRKDVDLTKHALPDDIVYKFLMADDRPPNARSDFVTDFDKWKSSMPEYPPHKLTK